MITEKAAVTREYQVGWIHPRTMRTAPPAGLLFIAIIYLN